MKKLMLAIVLFLALAISVFAGEQAKNLTPEMECQIYLTASKLIILQERMNYISLYMDTKNPSKEWITDQFDLINFLGTDASATMEDIRAKVNTKHPLVEELRTIEQDTKAQFKALIDKYKDYLSRKDKEGKGT